ncbi:hypothetical protein VCCP1035_1628C, partial [Vibrio cholerae CP1035(8)]
GRM